MYKATEVRSRETEETREELMQIMADTQGGFSLMLKLNQEIMLTEVLPDRTVEGWQQATQELDTLTRLMHQQGPASEHPTGKDGSGSQAPENVTCD
jgi:hypothetical protein